MNNDGKAGRRILEKRIEKNITQEELSKLTGISTPYISRIEKERVNVTLKTLLKMAEVFECSVDFLENGTLRNDLPKEENNISNMEGIVEEFTNTSIMSEAELELIKNKIQFQIDTIFVTRDTKLIGNLACVIEKYNDIAFISKLLKEDITTQEELTFFNTYCEKHVELLKQKLLSITKSDHKN